MLDASPWVQVTAECVEVGDGRQIQDYYKVTLPDYALIYPVTVHDQVLMFRQYKHGVGSECLLFPGGHVEPGEDPGAAATRELLEETGHRATAVVSLGSFAVCANQRCATAHLFRADGCSYERPPYSHDLEAMELVHVPRRLVSSRRYLDRMRVVSHVTLALLADRPPAMPL